MLERIADIDPRQIRDVDQLQDLVVLLINACDQLHTSLQEAQLEIQSLKDEINVLKGEHKDPKFAAGPTRPKQPLPGTGPPSEQSKRGNHKRGGKKKRITIDRTEMVTLAGDCLPEDAVLKQYKEYIQQDLRLSRDNVKYRVAIYYSPSQNKT